MQKDRAPLIAWTSITAVGIMAMMYHLRWMPVMRGDTDPALYSRGIGTPLLLWLNGYLGVFLNFQFLSPVGALSIPLLAYGLFRWKGLVRWQQALLVFTLLSSLVIGVFGGFNYRYALTLQPLLIGAVCHYDLEHCEGEDTRAIDRKPSVVESPERHAFIGPSATNVEGRPYLQLAGHEA